MKLAGGFGFAVSFAGLLYIYEYLRVSNQAHMWFG